MERWKEEGCLHMAPGQPGLIPGSWFFLVVYFLLLKMHLPMESKMLLNLFPHAKESEALGDFVSYNGFAFSKSSCSRVSMSPREIG